MIKLELLQDILKIGDDDLKHLNDEQLRDLLGTARFLVRETERELNQREQV